MFGNPFTSPLRIVCAAIVLVLLVALGAQTWRLHDAQAAEKTAIADKKIAETEKAAWKQKAEENGQAAADQKEVSKRRAELLAECQEESARIGKENRDAVAKAKQAQLKAEADKAVWQRNYERIIGQPECVRARAAYDAACPIGKY